MIGLSRIMMIFVALVALVGCDSAVTLSRTKALTAEEKLAADPDASFELLENSTAGAAATCSAQALLKFVLTQKSTRRILCRDVTALDTKLNEGPLCAGGLEIKKFDAPAKKWVPCEEVTICGKKAMSNYALASRGKAKMSQIEFSDLPWGCTGSIETAFEDQVNVESTIVKVALSVVPPPCPTCAATGRASCEICGTDSGAPEILDVITDTSSCNQVKMVVFAKDSGGLAKEAYSFDGGVTWEAGSQRVMTGAWLNVPAQTIRVRDRSGNVAKWAKAISVSSTPCPCDTPWGEILPNGQSRLAYKQGIISCTDRSAQAPISRTCQNGVLSGDASYKYTSFTLAGCPKCTLPWGEQIDNGESRTGYAKANEVCAESCKSTKLTCDRGTLVVASGEAPTAYPVQKCEFQKASCSCSFAGMMIQNGQTLGGFYASAKPACGQSCKEGRVTCAQGVLSGDIGYATRSCVPEQCKCTAPSGETFAGGASVSVYVKKSIDCSETLKCDDAANKMTIRCDDALANKISIVNGAGDLAAHTGGSCGRIQCGCEFAGKIFKPADGPLTVYKKDKVVSPERCDVIGMKGSVTCTERGGVYTTSGDNNPAVFKYLECQASSGGKSESDVGSGVGGGSGGGIGNGDGEGEGFMRRSRSLGTRGKPCSIDKPPYVCIQTNFGVGIGEIDYCQIPGENGYDPADLASKKFEKRIANGATMAAFSRKEVACGDSCSKYMGIIRCTNGTMSEKTRFLYPNCVERCP